MKFTHSIEVLLSFYSVPGEMSRELTLYLKGFLGCTIQQPSCVTLWLRLTQEWGLWSPEAFRTIYCLWFSLRFGPSLAHLGGLHTQCSATRYKSVTNSSTVSPFSCIWRLDFTPSYIVLWHFYKVVLELWFYCRVPFRFFVCQVKRLKEVFRLVFNGVHQSAYLEFLSLTHKIRRLLLHLIHSSGFAKLNFSIAGIW